MLRQYYARLSLSKKILLPLLSVSLGLWTLGTLSWAYLFAQQLENRLYQETEAYAAAVLRDFEQRKDLLFLKARWLADNADTSRLVAQQDRNKLMQYLLPMQASFQLELIKVVARDGSILLELKRGEITSSQLKDTAITKAASIGMDLFDMIPGDVNQPSILVGLTSIKSAQKILGGIIVGQAIDEKILEQIRSSDQQHLVTVHYGQVSASTLEAAKIVDWQPPPNNFPALEITIDKKQYIAKSVAIEGINGAETQLVILNCVAPVAQAKRQLWLTIAGFGIVGSLVFIFMGAGVTHIIVRRISNLTRATQKLGRGDLSICLQVDQDSQDEVNSLAASFNFMAEQLVVRDQKINQQVQELEKALKEIQQMPQLIQTEKMSSLGQMVAGVAHEINNPVSFIHGNIPHANSYIKELLHLLQLYQKYYPEPAVEIEEEIEAIDVDFLAQDLPKLLRSMQMGSQRIREIVLSLRNFSRLDEAQMKDANLHEGIDNSLIILKNRLKQQDKRAEIEVIREYGNLPEVECYPGQLNQVFMNLLSNAIDALEAKRGSSKEEDKCVHNPQFANPQISIRSEVINQDWIIIRIADNGSGIPKSVQAKLFDPFFTTKPVGKGTGLGLSISYQIVVEKHGGKLHCNSVPGKGTEFVIEIPKKQPLQQVA